MQIVLYAGKNDLQSRSTFEISRKTILGLFLAGRFICREKRLAKSFYL